MEYLLAGLPIVSTKSRGGRDYFFDDRFVKIVDARPEEVKRAVSNFVQRPIDPHFVRERTLERVMASRRHFYDLAADIAQSERSPLVENFEAFHDRIWGKDGVLARCSS
jgi:hypothetical protein